MSDDWIFSVKTLAFGALLALSVLRFEVQTVELESGKSFPEQTPQELIQLQVLQDYQDLTDQIRESERLAHPYDVAKNPSPESRDEAQQPQEKDESLLKELDHVLENLPEAVEFVTNTEEERRRESPEWTRELLAARQAELDALLGKQEEERAGQTRQTGEHRSQLEKKYAESPSEMQQHLGKFDKAAEAADKVLSDRHERQLKQLDERWQQKFEQFQEQPLIMPTDPDRDNR